jgi:hypothetical protein
VRRFALLMMTIGMLGGVASMARADEKARPPERVSSFQRGTFAVMRTPAIRSVPTNLKRLAVSPGFGARFGINPALARVAVAPDRHADRWYVVPSATGLCLVSGYGGTCQTDAAAARGKLWVQAIPSYGHDPASPLPPAGISIESRVVGVVSLGTTAVTASTKSGETVTGAIAGGLFAISGSDITALQLVRAPLVVPVFSG